MNSKQLSLAALLVAGALGGCAQQNTAPTMGATDTITTETTTTYEENMGGAGGVGGSGAGGRGQGGRGAGQYGQGGNGSDTATSGFEGGAGANYDPYAAELLRKQREQRQRQLAAERARQQAAARARQNGASGSGGNNGYGQYGQGGQGQYGQGQGGNISGQYGQGGSGGQYGNNSYNQGGAGGGSNNNLGAGLLAQRIVYFDYDQSSIKPQYMAILDAHANYLRSHPNVTIRLEGHADDRGSREYNLALSERRSRAVRDYMAVKGGSNAQMNTVGYGEEMPVKFGEDEDSWAQNRRVEIKYSGE